LRRIASLGVEQLNRRVVAPQYQNLRFLYDRRRISWPGFTLN
jgi:hypothetical protein